VQLRQKYEEISGIGAEVLAFAPDKAETIAPLLKILKLPYPILADPEHTMFHAYSLFVNNNLSGGDFVVDPEGVLHYAYRGVTPDDRPPIKELMAAVENAVHGEANRDK
jgi:peroxiredoxin